MKKRILSFMLVLALCFLMIPSNLVSAAKNDNIIENFSMESSENVAAFSQWAFQDLIVGDTYGIYPIRWYENGLTNPITNAQMRVLLAGLRHKLLNTNKITDSHAYQLKFSFEKLTVEEVLKSIYTIISSYDYTMDLELNKNKPIDFMRKQGIYTGMNGELSLKDTCTIEQACVFVTRTVTYLYKVLDAGSKGFLWDITQGDNKVYLLGSIHMANNDIYPFSEILWEAFHNSDALVVEANLLQTDGMDNLYEIAMYTDGTTLIDHVSTECYEKTMSILTYLGLPADQFVYYKPWFLWNYLSTLLTAGSSDLEKAVALGIDMTFTTNAYIYGKPILEIEGADMQLNLMNDFSIGLQEYLLNQTLDSIYDALSGEVVDNNNASSNNLKYWLELWRKGDVEAFKDSYSISTDDDNIQQEISKEELAFIAEYKEALFTKRDKDMADYIDYLLQNGGGYTYFVVVGSGHYIGDYTVIDILKEKGYEINQIK